MLKKKSTLIEKNMKKRVLIIMKRKKNITLKSNKFIQVIRKKAMKNLKR
jgi:hypothetical protein